MADQIKKQNRSYLSFSAILLLAVMFVLVNGVSKELFSSLYFDLTQDRLFSLSEGTKNILRSVGDPITLRFYYSKTDGAKFPAINLYGDRIAALLREYQRASDGKVKVESYDPRPDSEEEEWAQRYGLGSIPTRTGDKLFLGLAGTNSAADERAIPVFNLNRQEFLEYDVTKLIFSLVEAKKPKVAILSSLEIAGTGTPKIQGLPKPKDPWFFYTQLSDSADVQILTKDAASIAPDVDVLVVIHPKNLPEQALYAVDQFVMRGGKLFIAEDPFAQIDAGEDESNPMAAFGRDRSSEINRLTKGWGVELVKDKVVGDIELATKVNANPSSGPEAFVLWLSIPREEMNKEDVTTSALENVVLPWPGALTLTPVEGISLQPLFTSTKQAKLFDRSEYQFMGNDIAQLTRRYIPGGQEQVLAVRVNGKLKTAFPDGPPKQEAKEGEQKPAASSGEQLKESKGPANVVIIADVDFLSDPYSVSSQEFFGTPLVALLNDNQNFGQNVVENLGGSNDLINIRSRGQFSRPFTKVQEIEAQAQMIWQQRETVLQAKLNEANQRLRQLQAAQGGDESKQVFDKALLEEVKKFREERADAQQQLREVRRNLRQDKERLGNILFFLNTFFIPIALIIISIVWFRVKAHRRMQGV